MNRTDGTLQYRRLRAPKHHGEMLFDPPLANAPQLLTDNRASAGARAFDFQGRSFQQLVHQARSEMLAAAERYTRSYRDVEPPAAGGAAPIVMSGHQPELYHPGVWIKNFVLDHLARQQAAHAIHLLIDNDVRRTASIRVPSGEVTQPRSENVDFDKPAEVFPHEERRLIDRARFASFARRVSEGVAPFVDKPLVQSMWPFAIEAAQEQENLGQCLAQARHRQEEAWGLQTYELPLSAVCERDAFRWFTLHLLSHLSQFQHAYNGALHEYRQVNRVRSQSHPVPALDADGEWLEAPFWIWSREDQTRRRLFARSAARFLEITDRHRTRFKLPLTNDGSADRAVDKLSQLAKSGLKLRPRALLTTMFARLFLSDLFIHGIGGAKYDQLTDVLVQRFFGFSPPCFLVASATARLPIERPSATYDDLIRIDRTLRELRFNPQRHAAPTNDTAKLVAEKERFIRDSAPENDRRKRHLEVVRINEALQPYVARKRDALLAERAVVQRQLRSARLLGSREFSICLFPEATLRALLLDI